MDPDAPAFPRVRSCSANGLWGRTRYEANAHSGEVDYHYQIFRKTTDFGKMSTAQTFVFLDENPDSLNDGFLLVVADGSSIGDRPAVNMAIRAPSVLRTAIPNCTGGKTLS